jgi:hypothetical protein
MSMAVATRQRQIFYKITPAAAGFLKFIVAAAWQR